MKKLGLIALAVVSLLAAPANAADLPAKSPYHKAAPHFDWSGFYIGVDGGYLMGDISQNFLAGLATAQLQADGFVGGAHIGYRWQASASRLVYGLEADIWGADANDIRNYPGLGNQAYGEVNWGGSLRGVLGVSMSPTLLYVTGGAAFAQFQGCTNTGAGTPCGSSYSDVRVGWTVGAGIAHAITPQLIARVEYLHADYGDKVYTTDTLITPRTRAGLETQIVRAGLSWRFTTR